MEKELIIVSLTTWSKRIGNIPKVLDTIFAQTLPPDMVVLNLAFDEVIPPVVQAYIDDHSIEVYRTEDTKVYKKFLPTLKRYPDACVINVDDDMLYPATMIQDFWSMHLLYPNNPICGNHSFCFGRMCHCGEASLTKFGYFEGYLDCIDKDVMLNCPSSDLVFSYFASKAGHPYVPSLGYYGTDYTEAFNATESWTNNVIQTEGLTRTFSYLTQRFGPLPELYSTYIKDPVLADLIMKVSEGYVSEEKRKMYFETERTIRNSKAYRVGRFILSPFTWVRNRCSKKR
jgi:hypothetical protein